MASKSYIDVSCLMDACELSANSILAGPQGKTRSFEKNISDTELDGR
jgi:hypothetical protein